MALSDLTAEAVQEAIAEFDRLGREPFLAQYKFAKARGYFIQQAKRKYDSKAIAGVAHGFIGPGFGVLTASQFKGGEQTVVPILQKLGFQILTPNESSMDGIPFDVGQVYHRQRDIHEVFGGQERGGIATPNDAPFIFLFTGEAGEAHGYTDGWREDGSFAYTGEGQIGDMKFVRGNKAIRNHLQNGKDLLLFEAMKVKGSYRYVGCFANAGWEFQDAKDTQNNDRRAIVFRLVHVADGSDGDAETLEVHTSSTSLAELRKAAYDASTTPPDIRSAKRNYYARSAAVKIYVLRRANGRCESCDKPAPFSRHDGSLYLEAHHTLRRADNGPDEPSYVGAICPTCHREIHHGINGNDLNRILKAKLMQIENQKS